MQRLTVEGFGPIKGAELSLNDLMVFIGPQASGKSTISKLIYFFKSLRDEVLKLVSYASPDMGLSRAAFDTAVRAKFARFFGTTTHLRNFEIRYEYGDGVSLTLTLDQLGYVLTSMSPVFVGEFDKIIGERIGYQQHLSSIDEMTRRSPTFAELERLQRERGEILKPLEDGINSLFGDDSEGVYIPAGRSLAATLSDQLQLLNVQNLDFLTENFITRMFNWKHSFQKDMDELIEDRKRLTLQQIDLEKVRQAKGMVNSVLKGEYLLR